ncbi:MAG: ABC transporter ATP-binding protein [Thermoleophilia bacterium]|nr:ABC transporter ATP-binding protein [Thermoleophilia bacterium]
MIATRALTKRFGFVVALDDLDLEVEPGVIGLVGANGAGKSTLIKILLGLTEPTSGSAEMLGLDVASHGLSIRQQIGYMPEHDCLPLEISATEFVAHMARVNGLPRAAARERTAETLRHVGLYEERYREMRGYSTGMRQRVKLAQALVHDPKLMLLDEPTNGLDPAGRDEMLDLVRRIGSEFGISILMSSHLLTEIERVCDYLVVIEGGRLIRADTLSTFTGRTEILLVEVDGPADDLANHLRDRGYDAQVERHTLAIDRSDDGAYDAIRDGAASLELGLVRIEQRRQHLEDLFRDDDDDGDARDTDV